MTPKELQAVYELIEQVAEGAYKLGFEDAQNGREARSEGFKPAAASRLLIESGFQKLNSKPRK